MSAGAMAADKWRAGGEEPAVWAFGEPAINTAGYLWAEAEAPSVTAGPLAPTATDSLAELRFADEPRLQP